MRTLGLLLALYGAACGSPPATESAPQTAAPTEATLATSPGVSGAPQADCPRATSLDVQAVTDEVSCLMQQYVQIDTTNPPGNEIQSATFLQRVLGREGIESEIIESAPGRANLIARVPGKAPPVGQEKPKAVMLMHHMDVVPAKAEGWSVPPFSGTVRDGELWGRGAIDNKGGGIACLGAVLLLKRLGVALKRDVIFVAVADEEAGGKYGAYWLTTNRKDLFADVAFVLNEGGGIVELAPGRFAYSAENSQKAPLWLQVTARGVAGHGSFFRVDSAPIRLIRALHRLTEHQFPIIVLPEVQAMFTGRAPSKPEALRPKYLDLETSLRDPAFLAEFRKNPTEAAVIQNTLSITVLTGSNKVNVVPATASASLDVRILPGQDPQKVTDELVAVMADDSLEVTEMMSLTALPNPPESVFLPALEQLAKQKHPGAPVGTHVLSGFTDCSAIRAIGIPCYGFLPGTLTLAHIKRIHGKDERIPLSTLSEAVINLHALLELLPGASAVQETDGEK